jgi:protein ImuB
MTRIACFFTPMFPLAARLRSEPELASEAVAIVEGNGSNAHVVAATRRARKQGVRAGLSLAQARSIVPKLIARGRDSECERTAQEALLEVAESFSPRVEDAAEGIVYLDVTGMELHFLAEENEEKKAERAAIPASPAEPADRVASDANSRRSAHANTRGAAVPCASPADIHAAEERLARAALRAAERISMPIRVGIAASKLAARVAAELPQSPTVVAPGEEAAFLAPLPLARLTPELDASATLQRWGIASIGALAKLPESEIASRLGELGRELHRAARGFDPRPLMPRAMPPEFREGMELEWPLVALEPFLFIAAAALDRLARRLELQGFACSRLELTMNLEPDGHYARGIDLPAPTRDVKTMLTLLRLDLEKTPPGAPVAGFTLVAHPDRPRRAQLSLFGPAALSPEKLATAIAKLAAMLGADRIGMALTVDGHLPDRFDIAAFDPPPPPDVQRAPRRSRGLLAVRTFRPPLPVEVTMHDGDDDGPPRIAAIRASSPEEEPSRAAAGNGRTRVETGKKLEIAGHVRVASGPWAVEEGWWRDLPAAREYWDVELIEGGVYRMYRSASGTGWFLDAGYD